MYREEEKSDTQERNYPADCCEQSTRALRNGGETIQVDSQIISEKSSIENTIDRITEIINILEEKLYKVIEQEEPLACDPMKTADKTPLGRDLIEINNELMRNEARLTSIIERIDL